MSIHPNFFSISCARKWSKIGAEMTCLNNQDPPNKCRCLGLSTYVTYIYIRHQWVPPIWPYAIEYVNLFPYFFLRVVTVAANNGQNWNITLPWFSPFFGECQADERIAFDIQGRYFHWKMAHLTLTLAYTVGIFRCVCLFSQHMSISKLRVWKNTWLIMKHGFLYTLHL